MWPTLTCINMPALNVCVLVWFNSGDYVSEAKAVSYQLFDQMEAGRALGLSYRVAMMKSWYRKQLRISFRL